MAQLIKVRQCVSRYQLDLTRYMNRFLRLKGRRQAQWRNAAMSGFDDWLYRMQLEWATKTAERTSECPEELQRDGDLQKLLRILSDRSLLLYRPVLLTGQAAVQLDSLLLTDDEIWCVHVLKGEAGSVFQEISERKWQEIVNGGTRELLNPLIALKRTRAVVEAFCRKCGVAGLSVVAAVYAPDGYIEFVPGERGIRFVDRRSKRDWFTQINRHTFMVKKDQALIAEGLLRHCETVDKERFSDATF
ncbi:MAG: NERD domain-containing protein [Sporolactobacillus sp.]|jgi:hypothetical protein|nr:NERD domain-containing protein [Sporolactobacillus sp.]MCI1882064.1 NERD domain-containing protein [Sporolactobacillus sp.]